LTNDKDWQSLSGVTMDVKLSFHLKGRKEKERAGSFLFTHFGFSGPAALDISRFCAIHEEKPNAAVIASFLPQETEESFLKKLEKTAAAGSNQFLKNFLTDFGLTQSFAEVLLKKSGADPKMTVRALKQNHKAKLVRALFHYPLEVDGVYGYKKAEVTAGGIDLNEIRVGTMESKKMPGLYFAGEILNMDGRIGGFNFQWAWSTGWIAGQSAAKAIIA
jgi:predicted Rossmann fold flavoprotein